MKKMTWIDVFKEMGAAGDLLLILFLAILAYGCVIHFRKLGHGYRQSFFLLSLVQASAGLCCCLFSFLSGIHGSSISCIGPGDPRSTLGGFAESLVIVPFAAWLTIILLSCAALLFATRKRETAEEES